MPKKMFGLHKDETGSILGAFEFDDAYDLATLVRALDIRDGDWIDFKAVAERKSADPDEIRAAFVEGGIRPKRPSPTPQIDPALVDEQPL